MKITGIVTEYNPIHGGHDILIKSIRNQSSCDLLINVMSGNVVQRGDFAICDKWIRAQAAVDHGCDLVFEIPSFFVLQNSDHYAHGAIQLLALAKADTVVFGSECNNMAELEQISLKSVVANKSCSLASQYPDNLKANDRLGVAYIKACKKYNLKYSSIKRIDDPLFCAHHIREAFANKQDISKLTPLADSLQNFVSLSQFYPQLQFLLLTHTPLQISSCFLVDEGIENLFVKQAKLHDTYVDFLNACISKRYTKSKIQRTLMHILLQNQKTAMNSALSTPPLRVLAFSKKGRSYLRTLQDQGINVVAKFANIPDFYRTIEEKINYLWSIKIIDEKARKAWLTKENGKPYESKN